MLTDKFQKELQELKESLLNERSKSKKQASFMSAACKNKDFRNKVGISKSVACEFHDEDKGVFHESEKLDSEQINALQDKTLDDAKKLATDMISNTSTTDKKKGFLVRQIDSAKDTVSIIALLYNMMLGGDNMGVIGSKYSMKKNNYRNYVGESIDLSSTDELLDETDIDVAKAKAMTLVDKGNLTTKEKVYYTTQLANATTQQDIVGILYKIHASKVDTKPSTALDAIKNSARAFWFGTDEENRAAELMGRMRESQEIEEAKGPIDQELYNQIIDFYSHRPDHTTMDDVKRTAELASTYYGCELDIVQELIELAAESEDIIVPEDFKRFDECTIEERVSRRKRRKRGALARVSGVYGQEMASDAEGIGESTEEFSTRDSDYIYDAAKEYAANEIAKHQDAIDDYLETKEPGLKSDIISDVYGVIADSTAEISGGKLVTLGFSMSEKELLEIIEEELANAIDKGNDNDLEKLRIMAGIKKGKE